MLRMTGLPAELPDALLLNPVRRADIFRSILIIPATPDSTVALIPGRSEVDVKGGIFALSKHSLGGLLKL
jgi:hypothetical protein